MSSSSLSTSSAAVNASCFGDVVGQGDSTTGDATAFLSPSSITDEGRGGRGGSKAKEVEEDPGYRFYSIGDFGDDSPELKQTAEGKLS